MYEVKMDDHYKTSKYQNHESHDESHQHYGQCIFVCVLPYVMLNTLNLVYAYMEQLIICSMIFNVLMATIIPLFLFQIEC